MHTISVVRSLPRRSTLLAGAAVLLLSACSDLPVDPETPDLARKPRESTSTTTNPLAGATFYVDPHSNARRQADEWKTTRPLDAEQMEKIASRSQAEWFGGWNADVRADADRAVSRAVSAGAFPVLVAYNIPQRDCGGLSGGGGATPDAYRSWISAFADGIGTRSAAVVLEPDALPMLDCLSSTDQQTRLDLIRYAVSVLKAKGKIAVYLDAGHARWHSAAVIADRLKRADVASATGFSLNVSNFVATSENVTYGTDVSGRIGGKHFVIDTSRNGRGPAADGEWCNPEGRGLGATPTSKTGNSLVDAYLWIKRPGESDGACNGGPSAGAWWADYALGLAERSAL